MFVLQMFFSIPNGRLVTLNAKIVEYILLAGEVHLIDGLTLRFNTTIPLGIIKQGLINLYYLGLNILQHADGTVDVNADDKLDTLEPF